VWSYTAGISTPYITAAQIGAAIGLDESLVDLDAMMNLDLTCDDVWSTGDLLLFSIAPAGQFDGGEVWLWSAGSPAAFLNHGGHLWDTAFDVAGTFNLLSENVNALEAASTVPEPVSALFFGTGLVSVAGLLARRRVRKL
jgi:hypothetical protein